METQTPLLPRLGLRLLGITLFTQAGIVVTGALVRLTGSGLGCPTWPRCTSESFVPEPSQVEGFNKWIEFGNRLLTFVVAIAAIAGLVYVIRHHLKKSRLPRKFLFFAAIPLLGTLVQAVIGGITVLTDLNPFTVAAHFLVSVFIIVIAARNRVFLQFPLTLSIDKKKLFFSRLLFANGILIILLGVITTGSGPHAGDDVATRFNLDVATMAWLHADSVWLFTGLLIANMILSRNEFLVRIVAVVVVQVLVGYSQWFTGLPWALVAVHVALAMVLLVWLTKYQALVKQGAL
jgi:cytochrome c oxidase assembly protein subunit 15